MKKQEALMEVHGLGKRFRVGEREIPALEDVELAVREGEVLCIVGPAGCGKSTLLKLMAGLETPTKGQVLYRGQALAGPQPCMGMIFHNYALFPWLTLVENVALPLELRGVGLEERLKRARKCIALVGLEGFEDKYIKELPPGMVQRAGVARSLVAEPEIIFMDAPFGALDAYTASILRRDIVKILEETKSITVVMTTNSLTEAIAFADRVIILGSRPGRIKGEVKIDMERPRSETSRAFVNYYRKAFALIEKHQPDADGADGGETG